MAQPTELVFAEFTEAVAIDGLQMIYAYAYALFEGVTSVSVDVALPRNALVDDGRFQVQARRVDSVKVQEVAQVRSYANGADAELVIDFGTPRTVSGINLGGAANVQKVYPWLGSQFGPTSAFTGTAAAYAVFPELRTERLRVVLSAGMNAEQIAAVRLNLPEPPSGLEIRIDGAAPVWTHPEPVQPRSGVDSPDAEGWDKDSRRIVDLTAALGALVGDPLAAEEPVVFKLTLTTQVPCELRLQAHDGPVLRRLRRVRFGSETSATLAFASEGAAELVLPLPAPAAGAARRIDELRWVAQADLPPERVLPPLGPDAAVAADGGTLADLLITPERAACVRLPAGSGLAELTGLRLPLRALGDGAEARVVLWAPAPAAAGGLPLEALPQGASEPVTIEPSEGEAWVSFGLPKPVAIDPAAVPWMALVVARGQLSWALATAGGADAAFVDQQVVRRGPPNGPWKALPAPLQGAAGVLDARGRLRLVGLAAKSEPLAPMTIALAGKPSTDLLPTPKGAAATLVLAPGVVAAEPVLQLVSRVAGSLQLRDIDVVSNI